jgi:predicted N-acetyltransferase YhbS
MKWKIRELAADETHALRRAVSADGRTDLLSMHHALDDTAGAWHLGAIDETGRVVGISSFYFVPCPIRQDVWPAMELAFMAVDPTVQGKGIGSAVMSEAIRRLKATDSTLLWASARDTALTFYERFGFKVAPGSQFIPVETGRPHHLIELDIT